MIKSIQYIGVEVKNPPVYDDTNDFDKFLQKMDPSVAEEYHMHVLDIDLRGTPARW